MTRPYNPPVPQRIGLGRVITVEKQDDVVSIMQHAPMWKPIGEASASFDAVNMYIEQIDGYRVPVRRQFGTVHASELLDIENQNRVTREILREAMRVGEAQGQAEEAERTGRLEDAARLRSIAAERQQDFERSNTRSQARIQTESFNPFGGPYNW